jgi:hypothetical protein
MAGCSHVLGFKQAGGLSSFTSMQTYVQMVRLRLHTVQPVKARANRIDTRISSTVADNMTQVPLPRCVVCKSVSSPVLFCLHCVHMGCRDGDHAASHARSCAHPLGTFSFCSCTYMCVECVSNSRMPFSVELGVQLCLLFWLQYFCFGPGSGAHFCGTQ